MFEKITPQMQDRMTELEERDRLDRTDGTTRLERLRQIPPETGKFLAIMATNVPHGEIVEIGTSAGYSTLWLTLAAQERQQRVITCELLEAKIALAKETFRLANVQPRIDLREGDGLKSIDTVEDIAFCFLDCEKELYFDFYSKIVPKLVPGGLLIADNAINHQETLQPMMDFAQTDPRVDCLPIPIGKGEFLCRKR